jgi:hypothetical protein
MAFPNLSAAGNFWSGSGGFFIFSSPSRHHGSGIQRRPIGATHPPSTGTPGQFARAAVFGPRYTP